MRDIGYLSFGRYGQYAVTVITLPLVARVLGTRGLGLLAIGMSSYFFGSMLVDLGITTFLAAKMTETNVNQLRGNYLVIRATIVVILLATLVTSLGIGVDVRVHMVLLGLFVGGFAYLSEDWVLIGQGRFGASVSYNGIGRMVYLAAVVTVLPHLPSASVAMLCLLVSSAVTVTLTWRDSFKRYGRPSRPDDVKTMLRLGAPVLTSRLLVTSYGQGAAALYSSVLDAVSLGLYSSSDRLVQAVQSLLDAIGYALLPRMARKHENQFWRHAIQALLATLCVAGLASLVL